MIFISPAFAGWFSTLNNELENPIQTEKTISLANNSSTGNVTTDIAFENVVAVNLIYNDDFYYNPVVMTSRNLDGYLQVVLRVVPDRTSAARSYKVMITHYK